MIQKIEINDSDNDGYGWSQRSRFIKDISNPGSNILETLRGELSIVGISGIADGIEIENPYLTWDSIAAGGKALSKKGLYNHCTFSW